MAEKPTVVTMIISDTHIGGSTAIAPPEYTIHRRRNEEQTVHANQMQQWLWSCWTEGTEYARHLIGIKGRSRKNRFVVCHLGDVVDGIHHDNTQLVNEMTDQMDIAKSILAPLVDMADASYLTYGTNVHTGQMQYEQEIANALGMEHDFQFSLDVDGCVIDIAHHGRAGRRPWTSAAAGIVAEVGIDYSQLGLKLPRYVFRGHNHLVDDSGAKYPDTQYIAMPSWQLKTSHGQRVAVNQSRSDIGGGFLIGDRLDLSRLRYTAAPDNRRIRKVDL